LPRPDAWRLIGFGRSVPGVPGVGLLAVVYIAGLAGLAGCGGGDSATTTGHATPPPAAPLSIQERVATGSLAGLPPEGAPAERPTPAQLAADLRRAPAQEDIDALTRAGYVTGAVRTFRKGSAAAAYSFVVEAASAHQARALMRHLAVGDPSYTTPHRIERRALRAVPGSVVLDVRCPRPCVERARPCGLHRRSLRVPRDLGPRTAGRQSRSRARRRRPLPTRQRPAGAVGAVP
jgi:hypothetical protein